MIETPPHFYTPPKLLGTCDITTKRLDLRRFRSRDAQAVLAWSNDEQNMRFFCTQPLSSVEDANAAITSWRVQYSSDDFLLWCIQEAETKDTVGKISASVDESLSAAEIEYLIAPWARSNGYATEAVRAIIPYLHEVMGIHRVYARIHYLNSASMKVVEKAGMQWEGIERDALKDRNGLFYDVAIYSHLASDGMES